jgi:ABC-type uncharacterized transport system substrate-binding protein
MRRRDLVFFTAACVIVPPRWATAQPRRVATIGMLLVESAAADEFAREFRQALRELGYVEGDNVRFETRVDTGAWLPEMAAELTRLKVDVIVTWFTPAARAAKQATRDIPIVMGSAGNPVETGLVASLARPGGNVTGVAGVGADLAGKLVQLIRDAVPTARRIAALAHAPDPFSKPFIEAIRLTAAASGIAAEPVLVQNVDGLEAAFAAMAKNPPDAVIVQPSLGMERPPQLSLKYRIPAVSMFEQFAAHGGLISYATVYPDLYRTVASYVDKVLKGAKPAQLPVARPTKFKLTVNLKTAKSFGLAIPAAFIARADEVIE